MMIRFLVAAGFGLGALLLGVTPDSQPVSQVEACGAKVAVKAAPAKRNISARSKRRPIGRGGSKVASRKRVSQKSARTPIATGPDRQARSGSGLQPKRPKKSRKRAVEEPKRVATATPKKAERKKAETKRAERKKADIEKPEAKRDETRRDETKRSEPKRVATKTSRTEETPVEPTASEDAVAAVSTEIYFDTGSADLNAEGEESLQEIVEWLQANPNGRLLVEGHTDPVGSAAINRRLSRQRAKSVRSFLMSAAGVEAKRFVVKGHGEGRLRYSRNSPKNRRVFVKSR